MLFLAHINSVGERLRKQCCIISRIRLYVPRTLLVKYYTANIKSIIQYGVLVYGCASFSNSIKDVFQSTKSSQFMNCISTSSSNFFSGRAQSCIQKLSSTTYTSSKLHVNLPTVQFLQNYRYPKLIPNYYATQYIIEVPDCLICYKKTAFFQQILQLWIILPLPELYTIFETCTSLIMILYLYVYKFCISMIIFVIIMF